MQKVLLLPDYIGHPVCFKDLIPKIEGFCEIKAINYHSSWPYTSIEELSRKIIIECGNWTPDKILGYSFGGVVGYNLVRLLDNDVNLILIDTSLFNITDVNLDYEETHIPNHIKNYVELLEQLGEVSSSCISYNLSELPKYRPSGKIESGVFICCEEPSYQRKTKELWSRYINRIELRKVKSQHHMVLVETDSLSLIVNLLQSGE
jgi:hypothetical protein